MAEGQVTDTSAEREGKTVCEDMSHTSQRGRVHGESVKGVTYENGQGASHDSPALTLEMLFVESIKNGCGHPSQRLTDCHAVPLFPDNLHFPTLPQTDDGRGLMGLMLLAAAPTYIVDSLQ